MQPHEYLDLSQQAWDQAAEYFKHRSRVPGPLDFEQAKAHFAKIARSAFFTVAGQYANHVRTRQGQKPVAQPTVPQTLARWIEAKIDALDESLGHPGAKHYQGIANGFLAQLRAVEGHFLDREPQRQCGYCGHVGNFAVPGGCPACGTYLSQIARN